MVENAKAAEATETKIEDKAEATAPKAEVKAEAKTEAPKAATRKAPTRKAPARKAAPKKAAAPKAAAAQKAAPKKAAEAKEAPKAAEAKTEDSSIAAQVQTFAEDAFKNAREQVESQFETLKGQFGDMNIDMNIDLDEVVQFNKDNFDALVESGNKAAEAFDSLSTELRDFGTARWEDNVAIFKALTGTKSIQEAVDLQKDFAKSSYENFKAEGEKLAEMVPTLAKDVVAPLQDRATAAYDKIVKRDAA